MKYRFRAVESFWTQFYRLNNSQKEAARRAWKILGTIPLIHACALIKSNIFPSFTAAQSMP
jgi:hypothetical protein